MLEARIYKLGTVGLDGISTPKKTDILGHTIDNIKLNASESNYLSFDGNGIELLNNNLKFYEEEDACGYILTDNDGSQFISDSNCTISGGYIPFVNGNLNTGYNCFCLNGKFPPVITIHFYGNCCSEIVIAYGNRSNGNILKTQTVEVSKDEEFVSITLENGGYSQMNLYFTKTVLPNQCIRFDDVFDGTVSVIDKFIQHSLLEEINVLSNDLPINQFECSVSGGVSMIKKNTPLDLYSNHKPYGKYYVQTIERSGEEIYDIVAQNALCLCENAFRPWEHYALQGVAVDTIVKDLESLTCLSIDLNEVTRPEDINGVHTDGTCRYTLCELAYNSAKMVYFERRVDKNSVILIDVPTSVSSVITNSDRRIIGQATYKRVNQFTNAERKRQYIGTIDDDGMYTTKTLSGASGDVIELNFDKPTAIDGAGGVAIIEQTLFWKKIRLTADTGKIKYAEYPTGEKIDSISNLNTEDINGQITTFGDFLTYPDGNNALAVTDTQKSNIQKYISSQGTVTAKIRLRDEKVGDLIQIETAWDGIITGIITKMTISFGYEDIADIEVLQWST